MHVTELCASHAVRNTNTTQATRPGAACSAPMPRAACALAKARRTGCDTAFLGFANRRAPMQAVELGRGGARQTRTGGLAAPLQAVPASRAARKCGSNASAHVFSSTGAAALNRVCSGQAAAVWSAHLQSRQACCGRSDEPALVGTHAACFISTCRSSARACERFTAVACFTNALAASCVALFVARHASRFGKNRHERHTPQP